MFRRIGTICLQIYLFINRRKSVQYAIFWYYSIKQPYSLELFFTKEDQIYNRNYYSQGHMLRLQNSIGEILSLKKLLACYSGIC